MDYKTEFEQVYRSCYGKVFAFIFRLCGQNSDIADELTQETFVLAYQSFHRYDRSCTVLTWLCAIAKNVWFHYIRKHKNITVDPESISDTLPSDSTPDHDIERKELIETIRKAIDALPTKYRDVVWLRCLSDMPFSQIADILEITENSAKVLYFRAKNKIKERLDYEGFSY